MPLRSLNTHFLASGVASQLSATSPTSWPSSLTSVSETPMIRSLPPLVASRAFEAFGRTGSVLSAASELRVSPTVISRHIQTLQSFMCVDLVQRSGRRLVLTTVGKFYLRELTQALDLM